MTPVSATYRLQLRNGVDLHDARQLVPYLQRLGVSHLYLSPPWQARAGSTHGYDVTDSNRIDPALGGEAAYERLVAALHAADLGVIVDVVPNHAALSAEGPAFADVLAHGPASRFAPWFDIDWGPPDAARHARLLLPLLGDEPEHVLARGELRVARDGGRLRIAYFEHSLPLDPASWPRVLVPAAAALRREPGGLGLARTLSGIARRLRALPPRGETAEEARATRARESVEAERDLQQLAEAHAEVRSALHEALAGFEGPAGRSRLRALLAAQAWRLGHWRRARQQLNYRRFFDVNELIALRPEDPSVFEASHAGLLALAARGLVDGLRIDHVDGLLDPAAYLQRLRESVDALRPGPAPASDGRTAGLPIWVEKILAHDERLPDAWPVQGTTGYEFLVELEAVLVDAPGVRRLEEVWSRLTGLRRSFAATALAAKRRVLVALLGADLRRLVALLEATAPARGAPEASRAELRRALVELIAHLPAYRTYVDAAAQRSATDRALLARALASARSAARAAPPALDRLEHVLLDVRETRSQAEAARRLLFVQRLQQLSGPAAAKGIEDTALYVHVPLASRNDVGSEPGPPDPDALSTFHARCAERARDWPGTLLAGTTHDTKRSADLRARLDVLSEVPEAWREAVARWRHCNRAHRRPGGRRGLPDANSEYLLYQSLVGIWPLPQPGMPGDALPDRGELGELRERLEAYMLKATREAKAQTNWIDPDATFEQSLKDFLGAVLAPESAAASLFLRDLASFVAGIARPGLWNALSRAVVQLTAPGVPDLYQGDELWSFALVDPDNRRRVDFPLRARLLSDVERAFEGAAPPRRAAVLREWLERAEDGRIKLHLLRCTLAARRRRPDLFGRGAYVPLEVRGPRARHVIAFARHAGDRWALTVAVRLPRGLVTQPARAPLGVGVWGETVLVLPDALRHTELHSVLSGASLGVARGSGAATLRVAELFEQLPVALLLAG